MATRFLVAALSLAIAACGQQATTETTVSEDTTQAELNSATMNAQFVQAAATAGAFELRTSELAASRARLQSVKDFAQRMVTDHTAADQQLASVAAAAGLSAPAPLLSAEQQTVVNNLTGLNGEAFDDAYLDAQVAGHQSAVSTFQNYVSNGAPGPLRDWAQQTLPTLQQHLTDVQALEDAT